MLPMSGLDADDGGDYGWNSLAQEDPSRSLYKGWGTEEGCRESQ